MKIWLIVGAIVIVAVVAYFVVSGQKTETPSTAEQAAPAPAQVPVPTSTDPLAAQKQFLVDNLKQPDWKATPSGLEYKVVTAVPNAPKPAPGSVVTIQYEGRLIDGTVFDSSYKRNEPATFPLSSLIKGWQEGVPMMRVGEKWEFAIPSDLGYGDRGGGPIPGDATLLFTIELLDAKTPVKD